MQKSRSSTYVYSIYSMIDTNQQNKAGYMMSDFSTLVQSQKEYFLTNETKNYAFRKQSLEQLYQVIQKYEDEILQALQADLRKSTFESYITEIGILLSDIRFTLKHLKGWMRPKKVKTPITHIGSRSAIYSEPYGVAFIISPWNYPFQLAISPLIGALAAGNCAMIKPSEHAPHTAAIIEKIIKEIFPAHYVSVVQGDASISAELLKEPFDYIFFTGGEAIGKIVMTAAAKHLTPLTLELGGKSPAIVHNDANIHLAAKRMAWGKCLNAGQTCVAPDYVFVHEDVKDQFLSLLSEKMCELHGKQPLENTNFPKIINQKHVERLLTYLDDGKIYSGGKYNKETQMMEPTILTDVSPTSHVMQDEIFGPILPVFSYRTLDEVTSFVKSRPKPLALYAFTENKTVEKQIIDQLSFGGGCINDTIYHLATPYLPFGGVGGSGMGSYHGRTSFDTFSHRKSILKQTTLFDLPMRYPTMKNGLKIIKKLLK